MHTDILVGSNEVTIGATTSAGREVVLIEQGRWNQAL